MPSQASRKDLEKLVRLSKRLEKEEQAQARWDITSICHKKQIEFIRDPALRKIAVCGRRSGKTFACAVYLLETALKNDDIDCLFLAITRIQAKGLIWEDLMALVEDYKLPVTKTNENDLIIKFRNRSRIIVSGVPTAREMARFRGYGLRLAVIDEAQDYQDHLKDLTNKVIAPALWANRGTLVMTGTPSVISRGHFYETWRGKTDPVTRERLDDQSFKRFHWTLKDNPFAPAVRNGEATVEELMKEARDNASDESEFRREHLGQWDDDVTRLVWHWDEERNHYEKDELPEDLITFFGVDVGHNDADAIAVVGYSPTDESQRVWLLDEYVRQGEDRGYETLFDQIKAMHLRWSPEVIGFDFANTGAKAMVDLRERFGLNVENADKKDKNEFIKMVNDDLRRGKFRIRKTSQAAMESALVLWQNHKTMAKRTPSGGKHSDIWDAILYAWRKCKHFQEPDRPITRKSVWEWSEEEHFDFLARQNNTDGGAPWWQPK